VTAVVTVAEKEYESLTSSKQFATVPVAPVIRLETNSVTSSSALIKWDPPKSLMPDATITGFTLVYSQDRFSTHTETVNVEGDVRQFHVQNLMMGATYQFKVKMNMGPKWGETRYSSEMDVTTLETDSSEVQRLEESLQAVMNEKIETAQGALNGKINAAKNELRSEISSAYSTKANLDSKIGQAKNEIRSEVNSNYPSRTELQNALNNKADTSAITALTEKSKQSAICGYQDMWGAGSATMTFDNIITVINEVGSSLSTSGVYTAGVAGIYEASVSGFSDMDKGERAFIALRGSGATNNDWDKVFIQSGYTNSNDRTSSAYTYDALSATRPLRLSAGDQLYLYYTKTGNAYVYKIRFCITLLQAL